MPLSTTRTLSDSAASHVADHNTAHAIVNNAVTTDVLTVNIVDHGALGTWNGTTGADDTTALNNAVAAVAATGKAGSIYFPPLPTGRYYRFTSPLPNTVGMRYFGANRETTQLVWTAGSMLDIGTANVYGLIFEGLHLVASGSHLINMASTGSLYMSRFRDVKMTTTVNASSLVHQNGSGNFIENLFENCDLYRNSTATVPAFDIVNTGNACNENVWRRCRATSSNCTSTPFFRLEGASAGGWAYDNKFEDVVGEQNPGGLIHCYSVNALNISNVWDWDATTNYADHVIKVDKSTATSANDSRGINLQNVGRRGGTLGAGVKDVSIASGTTSVIIIQPDAVSTPSMSLPTSETVVIGSDGTAGQRLHAMTAALFDSFNGLPLITVSPTWASEPGLLLAEGVTSYTSKLLRVQKFGESDYRLDMDGSGTLRWGTGSGTFDVTLQRLAAGVLSISGGSAPTATAGANAGTSPPAPVVNAASRPLRGSITFGTGTTPATGAQLVVTFAVAIGSTPVVTLAARNSATAALGLYISAASSTGFTVSTTSAPTASQANTVYSIDYIVSV